jgi:hypothetical protein
MILYVTMSYEYEGGNASFVDFGDLPEETVQTILSIANFHKEEGSTNWEIEGRFPSGEVSYLSDWQGFLNPEYFFTYTRYGRKKPDVPGASRRTDSSKPRYGDIEPTDAFDRLPIEILEEYAKAFRAYLDDDEYTHLDDDSEVVFTPLFEKEVAARR